MFWLSYKRDREISRDLPSVDIKLRVASAALKETHVFFQVQKNLFIIRQGGSREAVVKESDRPSTQAIPLEFSGWRRSSGIAEGNTYIIFMQIAVL